MSVGLKPYPTYRDSGVPWLGELPEHWEMRKLRQVLRQVAVRNRPDWPLLSVVREKGVILRDVTSKDENHNFIPDDLSNYKVVRAGQFAMNKMKAWQGSYGISAFDGIVSPAYFVFDLIGAAPNYFHTSMRSRSYVPFFSAASDGVRIGQWDLSLSRMREIPFFVPPLPEQAAIERFLDYVDRRIRRYIRVKQKLIMLLEEQKQAIVHQAVTGQINVSTGEPYPTYKDSGVEWLGQIPEHWEITRLGRTISLTTGFPFKSEDFTQSEDDVRLLRGINVSPGQVRWDLTVRWPSSERERFSDYELLPGDIVLGMDRPIIRGGVRVAVIGDFDVPSLLLQRVARIRPHSEVLADFTVLLLGGKTFADYLSPIFTGISVPHLSPEQVKSFQLALPSIEEQRQVADFVRSETGAAQVAMERAKLEVSVLREYRTRLIADVVTGKLDVREVAARLPDEAAEPEPLEDEDLLADSGEADDVVDEEATLGEVEA
jgi:type I restriction enzyme, S subunit